MSKIDRLVRVFDFLSPRRTIDLPGSQRDSRPLPRPLLRVISAHLSPHQLLQAVLARLFRLEGKAKFEVGDGFVVHRLHDVHRQNVHAAVPTRTSKSRSGSSFIYSFGVPFYISVHNTSRRPTPLVCLSFHAFWYTRAVQPESYRRLSVLVHYAARLPSAAYNVEVLKRY